MFDTIEREKRDEQIQTKDFFALFFLKKGNIQVKTVLKQTDRANASLPPPNPRLV